jgi:hypothetical protein
MSLLRAVGRVRRTAVIAACCVLCLASVPARAHDIPNEILLSGFVKPEGNRLQVLLRVPLLLFLSVELPKRGPGYIDLARVDTAMPRAINAVTHDIGFEEDGRQLSYIHAATRISLPSESAFGSYDEALAHIEGPPLPVDRNVFWNQGYVDLHLVYPIDSERSSFTMDFDAGRGLPGRLKMAVRFMPPDGEILGYVVHGGYGPLVLNPHWYHAAATFVAAGFSHILDGADHLLFILCLLLPFRLREFWRLAGVVTAFTVAHSITLLASAVGMVPSGKWFPPLVEVLIATSIFYMAVENVMVSLGKGTNFEGLRWRWLVTAGFGLVHGFGFSFALKENLQFAGTHLLVSLLSFNVGVELGQILVLLVVLPVTALLFRKASARRFGIIISSVVIAHTAWHWILARVEVLRGVRWPELDVSPVSLGAIALLLALVGGLSWLVVRSGLRRRSGVERNPL